MRIGSGLPTMCQQRDRLACKTPPRPASLRGWSGGGDDGRYFFEVTAATRDGQTANLREASQNAPIADVCYDQGGGLLCGLCFRSPNLHKRLVFENRNPTFLLLAFQLTMNDAHIDFD